MKRGEKPIRVVYFGTPDYAVPTLTRFVADPAFDVVAVVSQPGRPAGRGRTIQQPPLRVEADRLGVPCLQPETLADAAIRSDLGRFEADLFVVAAYGRIFGKKTLAIPRYGCLNLHASILPKYRGASPVTAAILNGDPEAGVTLMVMERGLDTGPVIAERRCPIEASDTTGTLTSRLSLVAADLAVEMIPAFLDGTVPAVPQPDVGATVVRQLTKADGWIPWQDSAEAVERRTRAMLPWPRAWTTLPSGDHLLVLGARVLGSSHNRLPGHVQVTDRSVAVECGSGALELVTVQLPGGKPIQAQAAVAGRKLTAGVILGTTGEPVVAPPFQRAVGAPC